MGLQLTPVIRGDSSAAHGILARRGAGKVKHLETKQMWLQDVVRQGKLTLEKVPRNINPADLLTHHSTRQVMTNCSSMMNVEPIIVKV